MSKLPRVSGQQVVAALEKLGFRVRRQNGSHIIMRRDNPFAQTVVPAHRELEQLTSIVGSAFNALTVVIPIAPIMTYAPALGFSLPTRPESLETSS
jgi:predicted RNA binding protein YcfA (HicA-like mRNA interferase family)